MAVVVFLSLREKLAGARAVRVKRKVFVNDGLHVRRGLGRRPVSKRTSLELGQDCYNRY